jgi:fructosamine-3-kinase
MKAIHGLMPDFATEPVNFGKYTSNPEICFFIKKFVDMTDEIPEADSLPEKVAKMHRKGISPNGKYGCHVPINQGALQQPNTRTISWEKFFTEMVTRCSNWELQIHGEDKEMQELFKNMVEKVIPRLLRPLEPGGNDIKPRLVHGNLWEGNARSNIMTDKPIIYDARSMYAHNECTLPKTRCSRLVLIQLS